MSIAAVGGLVTAYGAMRAWSRIELSRAKHRSLAGHPRMARRISKLLPYYGYNDLDFFDIDGAPKDIANQRSQGFRRLTEQYRTKYVKSVSLSKEVETGISDAQFINMYRVPFQFRKQVSQSLRPASFVASTAGMTQTDLDGNVFFDLTGSFGVNVFGHDLYKTWMADGSARVQELGLVLGSYHPVVAQNVSRLKQISGMDEVSFHMSGTEAVMQAVRLARYHTGRRYLVRFCGSYHGWWGEVQPGIGNPTKAHDTFNLQEMSEQSLRVLRNRKDIACVLVNPIQAMHPNANAPGDSALLDSSRNVHFDRVAYTQWLNDLRAVCDQRGIALIFDEVFVGFRLALGGAQSYFGVRADLVTYGKTVGGGFPIGVVCGKHAWMKRFRDEAPADICFARGTFNSHPYVMGAMHEFLEYVERPQTQSLYESLEACWDARAKALNEALSQRQLPVQVAHLSTIWAVTYSVPSRYNWMFQYYLRLEGLALSWVGTGRLIFCINMSDSDFAQVMQRFILAAEAMRSHGWWWSNAALSNRAIKRGIMKEMLASRWPALRRLVPTKRPVSNVAARVVQ
jgi:glutamate-1-semialdehyde 2,1-aminomutase